MRFTSQSNSFLIFLAACSSERWPGYEGGLSLGGGSGGSPEPDNDGEPCCFFSPDEGGGERRLLRSEDGSSKSCLLSGERMGGDDDDDDPCGFVGHDDLLSRASRERSLAPAAASHRFGDGADANKFSSSLFAKEIGSMTELSSKLIISRSEPKSSRVDCVAVDPSGASIELGSQSMSSGLLVENKSSDEAKTDDNNTIQLTMMRMR